MALKGDFQKIGMAQAAVLSVVVGILTLAFINLGTVMSQSFNDFVHSIGKLWMPGAEGIGPYSGKETFALVAWLGSWFILHRVLHFKQWKHVIVMMVFLAGIGVATTLLWPPVFTLFGH